MSVLCFSISSRAENGESSKDNFDLSKGHIGLELDMMPGGPENGSMLPFVTWENDLWIFSLGGNFYHFNDDFNGKTNLWQAEARVNHRLNISRNSFLDLGIDFSWQCGTQNGASAGSNYSTGPMIGFSRQFPGTNVFFTAFVVVAQYMNVNSPQLSTRGNGWAFFENGGVGIRYAF